MIIGLVPARSGSKRIRNKNIYKLNGKPLVQYTLEAAKNSKLLDDIVVTTDSKKIISLSKDLNIKAPFVRPKKLSGDKVNMLEVIKHAIKREIFEKVKLIVLLQPTSPLRTGKDIDSAIKLFYKKKPDTLVSVTTKKNVRKKSKIMIEKNGYLSFFNNKIDFYNKNKEYIIRNGPAILITKKNLVIKGKIYGNKIIPYKMKKKVSIDINYLSDLRLVKKYLRK